MTTTTTTTTTTAAVPGRSPLTMWSDLPRRLLTIGVGVPLLLWILSRRHTCRLFFGIVHGIACWEWISNLQPSSKEEEEKNRLQESRVRQRQWWILSNVSLAELPASWFPLGMVVLSATFLFLQGSSSSRGGDCSHNHHQLHGLLYITWPFHTWKELCTNYHYSHIVTLLCIVWMCDTGALVFGRFSKMLRTTTRQQQPRWLTSISPQKSISGILGGLVVGTVTTLLIPSLWKRVQHDHDDDDGPTTAWWRQKDDDDDKNSLLFRLLFGFALSILAILGDLTESMIKRRAHTKDANQKYVLPGHGGVLDRFDSTLLSVILYYAVLQTIK